MQISSEMMSRFFSSNPTEPVWLTKYGLQEQVNLFISAELLQNIEIDYLINNYIARATHFFTIW